MKIQGDYQPLLISSVYQYRPIIDVYRSNAAVQKNPLNVALSIPLFSRLVAGPIVRYTTIFRREFDN